MTTRIRHHTPPNPDGCRWCGIGQRGHARQWIAPVGWHRWEQPTDAQRLARMRARRFARISALPAEYHATTSESTEWNYACDTPETTEYCADCGDTGCRRWMRVQDHLDQQRLATLPAHHNPSKGSR